MRRELQIKRTESTPDILLILPRACVARNAQAFQELRAEDKL